MNAAQRRILFALTDSDRQAQSKDDLRWLIDHSYIVGLANPKLTHQGAAYVAGFREQEREDALPRPQLTRLETLDPHEGPAPHTFLDVKLYPDGDQWCCLHGKNLQVGIAGFGSTPQAACTAFDVEFLTAGAPKVEKPPTPKPDPRERTVPSSSLTVPLLSLPEGHRYMLCTMPGGAQVLHPFRPSETGGWYPIGTPEVLQQATRVVCLAEGEVIKSKELAAEAVDAAAHGRYPFDKGWM